MRERRCVTGMTLFFFALVISACAAQHETASTDFGGQPKDQEARERHHPQYPESARHLGPQEDQPAASDAGQSGGQTEAERAAVSGVGK